LSRIGGFSGLGILLAVALFAGHETTVVRIDVRTLLLLANPGQREALRARRDECARLPSRSTSVIAWLDASQPDPEGAAARIFHVQGAVPAAAQLR
jgi:cytochrome P450